MKFRTPLALAGAAALAVTTGLVTTANPSQAAATKSYAWGFAINGEPKQPYVESTDGSTQTNPDASFPAEAEPLVSGDIIKFQAGNDYANISIADFDASRSDGQSSSSRCSPSCRTCSRRARASMSSRSKRP